MKQVLLTKHHDITSFASEDPSRFVLQSVHYRPDTKVIEATNGKCLIRVPVTESDDFPPVKADGTYKNANGPAEPVECIIPAKAYKKGLANIPKGGSLPVLEYAKLDANGTITLSTTDLDTEQTVTSRPVGGTYPNCDQVWPDEDKKPILSIALSARLLAKIVDYAQKHGATDEKPIVFEFLSDLDPVKFRVAVKDSLSADVVNATGLIMPMRLS